MLYSYDECIKKYGSNNNILKAIKNGKLFKLEKGIYSNNNIKKDLEIILKKYPKAILTMDYAFYYHNLTDTIPNIYHIATTSSSRKLNDYRIKQIYIPDKIIKLGVIKVKHNNINLQIYDKERMLIETIRYKNSMPYDYYKEIINNYRNIIYDLDIARIETYAKKFPKSKMIIETLEKEVF